MVALFYVCRCDVIKNRAAVRVALYSKVLVAEFDAWCFDTSRKVGDTGIVKTTYGYHVMFYSGDEALWIYECREALRDELITEFVTAAVESNELQADYEKMLLGHMDLTN